MVVDTMVFAYALLGVSECREQAAAVLEKSDPIVAPDSLHAELINVIWQWVRHREVPSNMGFDVLADAEALITRSLPATHLWGEALALAIEADHPAYDTLFIAAAERENTRVVTFDGKLIRAFPEQTLTPEAFLAKRE